MQITSRLRRDLVANLVQDAEGASFYDVKDPKTGGSLRLYDFEWLLAQQFNGRVSWNELQKWSLSHFNFEPTENELQAYYEKMAQLGMWQSSDQQANEILTKLTAPLSLPKPVMEAAEIRSNPPEKLPEKITREFAPASEQFTSPSLATSVQEEPTALLAATVKRDEPIQPDTMATVVIEEEQLTHPLETVPSSAPTPRPIRKKPRKQMDWGAGIAIIGIGLSLAIAACSIYYLVTS